MLCPAALAGRYQTVLLIDVISLEYVVCIFAVRTRSIHDCTECLTGLVICLLKTETQRIVVLVPRIIVSCPDPVFVHHLTICDPTLESSDHHETCWRNRSAGIQETSYLSEAVASLERVGEDCVSERIGTRLSVLGSHDKLCRTITQIYGITWLYTCRRAEFAFRILEVQCNNLYSRHVQSICNKAHCNRSYLIVTPVLRNDGRADLRLEPDIYRCAFTQPRVNEFFSVALLVFA